jgi:uncharacterized membrane protein
MVFPFGCTANVVVALARVFRPRTAWKRDRTEKAPRNADPRLRARPPWPPIDGSNWGSSRLQSAGAKQAREDRRTSGALAMADLKAEQAALPSHVEGTIHAIGRLQLEYHEAASPPHRLARTITIRLGRPGFLAILAVLIPTWILINLALWSLGWRTPDPPPFLGLEGASSFVSLFVVIIVLATQQRDQELAQLHQQLTLQLAILAEQKAAKLIELVEELRRDHPNIPDRVDRQAQALAQPADPESVLNAIKASQS